MSLCDTCRDPGACCRDFILYGSELDAKGNNRAMTKDEVNAWRRRNPGALPFEYKSDNPDGSARWSCPKLTIEGRCSIYDTRPALCRNFEAGTDYLCVETPNREQLLEELDNDATIKP